MRPLPTSEPSPREQSALPFEQLTAILAQRLLGWTLAPERFMKGKRQWIPRWHFQPFRRLEDAFKLLDTASATFSLTLTASGTFTARVRVGSSRGSAKGESKPAVITLAIARAIGLDVPDAVSERDRR